MTAIRVRRKLESETLYVPELKPLLGKSVEIIVLENATTGRASAAGDWDAAMKAVEDLEDCDFDAVLRQREYDVQHAKDHSSRHDRVKLDNLDLP